MKSAFLFDLNGTMIDDMACHTEVWFDLLNNKLNARMTLEEVKRHMYGRNEELLVRLFGDRFSAEEMAHLSLEKEKHYQQLFLPHLKLLDGLSDFLDRAKQEGIKLGIGTAAIPFNVDFVLDNLHIRNSFEAIVTADDVTESKPHPEVYTKLAAQMNVNPEQCLVFEDSPKGVEAALEAGMQAVIVTTSHTGNEFDYLSNVVLVVKDFTDPRLQVTMPQNDGKSS